jgi:4-hydroxy-tetrahydrodipicolinate synthase
MLTYEKLMGMWNGLTTPWTQKGTLDADAFQHNINRCVKAGSPGIYTGGGTNEFYAQDFDLFRELTDILLDTLKGTGVPNQIGISALTTDEIVKRGRYAIEKGADALQVTFPFWTRLREIEAVDFYKDLYQEFRPYPIIHFDTEFNKHMLNRDLLGKMKNACPTLIGVKFDDSDLDRFADMALNFPDISFFVPENLLAAAFPLGARGCYSAYANANPYFMKRYFKVLYGGQAV